MPEEELQIDNFEEQEISEMEIFNQAAIYI